MHISSLVKYSQKPEGKKTPGSRKGKRQRKPEVRREKQEEIVRTENARA